MSWPATGVLIRCSARRRRRRIHALTLTAGVVIVEHLSGRLTPLRAANAHLAWKRWLRRHGLEDTKFHVLRHTAATLMIEAGIDLFKVSRTLGHTSIRTTADIYGHLTAEGRHEVAERMHAALLTVGALQTGSNWGQTWPTVGGRDANS